MPACHAHSPVPPGGRQRSGDLVRCGRGRHRESPRCPAGDQPPDRYPAPGRVMREAGDYDAGESCSTHQRDAEQVRSSAWRPISRPLCPRRKAVEFTTPNRSQDRSLRCRRCACVDPSPTLCPSASLLPHSTCALSTMTNTMKQIRNGSRKSSTNSPKESGEPYIFPRKAKIGRLCSGGKATGQKQATGMGTEDVVPRQANSWTDVQPNTIYISPLAPKNVRLPFRRFHFQCVRT